MKKGFTLAETLVALAIIGVMAGIMFPVMNSARPNKEMVMYRKAYYLAGRAISDIVNDEALYPETGDPATEGLANTTFAARFKGENNISGGSKFCRLLALKLNSTCDGGTITTSDGMIWTVPMDANFENGRVTIRIDVNGGNVECNDAQQCTKPDQFNLIVHSDGTIRPNGYLASLYLSERDTTKQANKFDVDRKKSLSTSDPSASTPVTNNNNNNNPQMSSQTVIDDSEKPIK